MLRLIIKNQNVELDANLFGQSLRSLAEHFDFNHYFSVVALYSFDLGEKWTVKAGTVVKIKRDSSFVFDKFSLIEATVIDRRTDKEKKLSELDMINLSPFAPYWIFHQKPYLIAI